MSPSFPAISSSFASHMTRLQHFYGTGPHPLMWAGSRAARAKITVSGAPTCLIECDVFL